MLSTGIVDILGFNQAWVLGSTEYINEIPDSQWDEIITKWSHVPEIKLGLIFAQKDNASVKAQEREVERESTSDARLELEDIETELKTGKKVKK